MLTLSADKVLYEGIMTNDDNLDSNLLTSILLKMLVQVLLQAEPDVCVEVSVTGELLLFIQLVSIMQQEWSLLATTVYTEV